MHEIRIAEDLSVIVLDAARKENLSKVTKVNISFGQMVQIVPDIFEFAFRETVRNSIAQDAETDIEIIPVKMRCKSCGSNFQVEENSFVCIQCNSTDLEIIQGKELFIKSIEGE
jgi:hydrogenase nickel incorporation protein HypA/HybF